MLSLPEWKCPAWTQNATQVDATSPEFIETWQKRMREVILGNVAGMISFLIPNGGIFYSFPFFERYRQDIFGIQIFF